MRQVLKSLVESVPSVDVESQFKVKSINICSQMSTWKIDPPMARSVRRIGSAEASSPAEAGWVECPERRLCPLPGASKVVNLPLGARTNP